LVEVERRVGHHLLQGLLRLLARVRFAQKPRDSPRLERPGRYKIEMNFFAFAFASMPQSFREKTLWSQ
jgi:hypothetical protein